MSTLRFGTLALDTPDPRGLAAFYGTLLGWEVEDSSDDSGDDWVTIGDGGTRLSFQLAPDHVPPTWPAGPVPQQAHVDLWVSGYAEADAQVLALGGRLLEDETDHPTWRVYADPSGHPFCLCLEG